MNHMLRSDQTCDFDGFTDIVHRLLKAAWGEDWGTFCEAFPNGRDPRHLSFPVITYTLQEMRPGAVGKNKEIKPRFRDSYTIHSNDESEPKMVSVFSQVFEYDVCFEIWEENNQKANELAKRFRQFLSTYTGYLMKNGVQQLIFVKMSNENLSPKWREDIVVRKLEYLLRLEEQFEVPSDVIKKVTGSISVADQLPDNSIDQSRIDFTLP